MESLLQDVKYGVRMLAKAPAFTLVAALSLGLGIGANTAIFTLINATLLRPFPAERPDRIVAIYTTDQRNPGNLPMSHLNFTDLRDHNQVFSAMTAFTFAQMNLDTEGEAEQVQAQLVAGNYFDVLGTRAALGRTFRPDEDRTPGTHPVVVLSHGFWARRFGGDRSIVGRTVTLNRQPFTVIGIAPRGFSGTFVFGAPDLFVPMMMHEIAQPGFDWYNTRRGLFLFPFGRLGPGVTMEQARSAMATLAARLEKDFPRDNAGRGAALRPLLEARIDPSGEGQLVQVFTLLTTIVGVVLLIACGNIANLLLARAAARRREIAIRLALGASRGRLVRQLLTESIVLALIGGGVGLLLAWWTLPVLTSLDAVAQVLPAESLTPDARILTFTAALSLLTGLLFGLAPGLGAAKPDVVPVLKDEGLPSVRLSRAPGLRQALAVAQVALSLVALVAAGLFVRSLQQTEGVDPGFETDRVLLMTFNLGREGYTPERGRLFYQQVTDRVASRPGVRAATVAQSAPFGGFLQRSVFLEGQEASARDRTLVSVNRVGLGYFRTLGIPVLRGRDFQATDTADAPPVAIINQMMAERFWPGQDALAKRFQFFGETPFTVIVGIVRDSKYNSLTERPRPFIYEPIFQDYVPTATLHVRSTADAGTMTPTVRGEVLALDKSLSMFNVQTLRTQVDQSLAPQRFNVRLLTTFGLLALVLAALGIYGVASYSVSQRTREIGIRMAVGASDRSVLGLVLRQGMRLVGIGVAIGLVCAFFGSRLLGNLLFGIRPTDPLTFSGTSAILATVALLASYLPARRAARVDPLRALRHE